MTVINSKEKSINEFTAPTIPMVAKACFKPLLDMSLALKNERLKNNINFLAHFQNSVETNATFKDKQLAYMRKNIVQYLSVTQVFLSSLLHEQSNLIQFLKALLTLHLEHSDPETCQLITRQGKFTEVILGRPSGLQFIQISQLIPKMNEGDRLEQIFKQFSTVAKLLQEKLGIDILSGMVTSGTSMAKLFFDQYIHTGSNFTFISPSANLYKNLMQSCRYGHLQAYPSIASPNSNYKSFIITDFIKFHTQILGDLKPFFGNSIKLVKSGLEFFVEKKMNFHSFANVFFSSLSKVCLGKFFYQLLGPEETVSNNSIEIDCVIKLPKLYIGPNEMFIKTFSFLHGCYWHSHFSDCHQSSTSADHGKNCDICKTACQPSRAKYRPSLWKLPEGTNFSHPHPHIKKTYEQIHERTNWIDATVTKLSETNAIFVIRECILIKYWDQKIVNFLEYLDLPAKYGINQNQTLGQLFEQTVTECFPLLYAKKITMQRVINEVRAGHVHGQLQISGTCGPKIGGILGDFKIFSHKNEKGEMINSNDIKEKIVTSDFLKYLLQPHELPDFILTSISTIYIYMNYPKKPFASACDKIMNLLEQYKENGQFCSVLKSLGNLYCGLMGVTARYPNVHLLKSTDFESSKEG